MVLQNIFLYMYTSIFYNKNNKKDLSIAAKYMRDDEKE